MTIKRPRITQQPPRVGSVSQRRVAQPRNKETLPFYRTQRWAKFAAHIIKKRGRRCEECARDDTRIFLDHIMEIQDGGELFDETNIKLLCGSCHTAKTLRVRMERMIRK